MNKVLKRVATVLVTLFGVLLICYGIYTYSALAEVFYGT